VGQKRRGERGQALVEAALIIPLLMLIAMGAVDFGRLYYSYTTIANAAREGAMCASLGGICPAGAAGAATAEVNGTLPGGVTTTVSPSGTLSAGSTVTVTVHYNFQPITTVVVGTATLPLSASASMVVQ